MVGYGIEDNVCPEVGSYVDNERNIGVAQSAAVHLALYCLSQYWKADHQTTLWPPDVPRSAADRDGGLRAPPGSRERPKAAALPAGLSGISQYHSEPDTHEIGRKEARGGGGDSICLIGRGRAGRRTQLR
ncbi:hypothetical protein EVAR_9026_1 [Eumeta japonica]|uniref:Uncharacterized protein n=1 Tax=Eumeta variegata TaxID=151549 RepID=A0A4C1TWC1_EUMVA|nr:hypothetical protein EVAR_9026_1 [Eumeta japonica]